MKDLTDLRTIQALVTVAHEGNVSRAAELLHLTQPAVSLQLKRLAADTGLTLFRRSRAGLELTRDGHSLATKAENVLNAAKDFGLAAERLKGSASGKLRLGTIIDPDFVRLGALLSALSENAPELETELKHGMSGDVPGKIERGECDAGYFLGDIASFNERAAQRKKPRFACNTLARFTYWVVAPAGWETRLIGKSWPELAALPWIGTPPASVHHRLLNDIFAEAGVTQNTVALVDQESSMLAMVRSGVGLSLCRDSIALFEKQAHGIVINDIVELDCALSFIAHANRVDEPRIRVVFAALADIWSGEGES